MTYTQTFIEKTIEGGYSRSKAHNAVAHNAVEIVLLDPAAWQAVGKVEGWTHDNAEYGEYMEMPLGEFKKRHWKTKMHRMIDHLAEGKTHEQYLKTLFTH